MYTYTIGISKEEHDSFVKHSSQTNLLQSSSWGDVKDNWKNERIGFYQNGQQVASASILIRPLPLGMTMLYIPRGPIMDYNNTDLVAFVLDTLKQYGKKQKALFIKFDPTIFIQRFTDKEKRDEHLENLSIIHHLEALGCDWTGRTEHMEENIQPRFQANIYAEHFSEEKLSKSVRQGIRTARNKGITIQFGGIELTKDLADLIKKTENRKQINLRGQDYFEKMMTVYPEQSYITLASLPIKDRIAQLEEDKKKLIHTQEKFTEKTKPSKIKQTQEDLERLEEELHFLLSKDTPKNQLIPIAATLTLEFGGTSENIYAGMDDDFKRYNPALITWFETAKHSFERGNHWLNMGGVENDLNGGLYHFKSKLLPTFEEFAGEFNLVVNPLLYRLSNLAYKVRKKLRNKH